MAAASSYVTPERERQSNQAATSLDDSPSTASIRSSSPTSTLSVDKLSASRSYGSSSVLDQLHAEQRSTIEALTSQVEFYRQREQRYKKEVDVLRSYLSEPEKDDDHAAMIQDLAAENRSLGDQLDSMRNKQAHSERNCMRAERKVKDLEKQLQDARDSLASFSGAIEQLELKMQRREAEVQTRCLELEHELRARTQQRDQLEQQLQQTQQMLDDEQTRAAESERLRMELQASSLRMSERESTVQQLQREMKTLQSKLARSEQSNEASTQRLREMEAKLTKALEERSSFSSHVRELELKLENANQIASLHEHERVNQSEQHEQFSKERQDLVQMVASLQREKQALEAKCAECERELENARSELRVTRSRLSTKDNSVMVTTLRNEITALKERIRLEIKRETQVVRGQRDTLEKEKTTLQAQLHEKDTSMRSLQDQVASLMMQKQGATQDIATLQRQVKDLESALNAAHSKYQELLDCRSTLADQLDVDIKQWLVEDEQSASAMEEAAALRQQVRALQTRTEDLERDLDFRRQDVKRAQRLATDSAARFQSQMDELYQLVQSKEEEILKLREQSLALQLLEQEKKSWERQTQEMNRLHEQQLHNAESYAQSLKDTIAELEQDRLELQARIKAQANDQVQHDQELRRVHDQITEKEAELCAAKAEHDRLLQQTESLHEQLELQKTSVVEASHDKKKREQRLGKERQQMQEEMQKLLGRIEQVSTRNAELGEKVISLMRQSKRDRSEIVALTTQLKAYRQKNKALEDQLLARDQSEEMDSLQRSMRELTCLKESLQIEVRKLRDALATATNEKDVALQQRDDAKKRIKLLMKCQDHMKATVEAHTTELVQEIEQLQHQVEQERKRCAVLLANEKALMRDVQERNASITKLQQALGMAKRQGPSSAPREPTKGGASTSSPRSRSSRSTTSNSSRSMKSTALKSHKPAATTSKDAAANTGAARASRTASGTATKELDRLLTSLERISQYSS